MAGSRSQSDIQPLLQVEEQAYRANGLFGLPKIHNSNSRGVSISLGISLGIHLGTLPLLGYSVKWAPTQGRGPQIAVYVLAAFMFITALVLAATQTYKYLQNIEIGHKPSQPRIGV